MIKGIRWWSEQDRRAGAGQPEQYNQDMAELFIPQF
jgi:hypothetical protein